MNKKLIHQVAGWASSLLVLSGCGQSGQVMEAQASIQEPVSFYDFVIPAIGGTDSIRFSSFRGKKVLLVNVASKCGYTPQYESLQALYEAKNGELVIIGLPCNQFMFQEPGSDQEIVDFCHANYGVTFPLTSKIDVKGKNQHGIYQWLTQEKLNGLGDFEVSWNFNKFLISEDGHLLAHFNSDVKPLGPEIGAYLKGQ